MRILYATCVISLILIVSGAEPEVDHHEIIR